MNKLSPRYEAPHWNDHEEPKNKMQIKKSHLKFAHAQVP